MFFNDWLPWPSSHVLVGHLYIFFEEISVQSIYSFLSCLFIVICIYIFPIFLYCLLTSLLVFLKHTSVYFRLIPFYLFFLLLFILLVPHLRSYCLIPALNDLGLGFFCKFFFFFNGFSSYMFDSLLSWLLRMMRGRNEGLFLFFLCTKHIFITSVFNWRFSYTWASILPFWIITKKNSLWSRSSSHKSC
jgi:hypothetical protein